jgi:enamine deaminase RidA (YjgF/YER057c/UK114 family)
MKTVELTPLAADISSFRTYGFSTNIALHNRAAGEGHAFIVASVLRDEDAAPAAREVYSRIAEALSDGRWAIVHERIFGSLGSEAVVLRERQAALSERQVPAGGPVTYISGDPPWGEGLSGVIIHAVSLDNVDDVWTIMDGNVPCGRGWRRSSATYLQLQNIQGQIGTRHDQVRRMFDRAERILRQNGASYKDVARTWLYLSEILDWYPDFNKARSEKYGEFGIMPGPGDSRLLLPASTGIGADTPSGAAASMDLLAVIENGGMPSRVRKLTNRKQLDAFRYGAAFSRGAVIQEDDVKIIQVSGTAAIDEHGVSLYPGDIRSQIICTFDKVQVLLDQEGAGLGDICAATVFVKRPEYVEVFREVAADRGLAEVPAVCVVADVCREELLFEIDAEAFVSR